MNSQSRLSHHERCPKCAEMGKDTSGDNLAVYTDGSAFCFSCHYVRRADKPPIVNKGKIVEATPVAYRVKPKVEGQNFHWLSQYLNTDEIDEYFFMDNTWGRHIFLHNEGEPDWFLEARSVRPSDTPKSIQKGAKPSLMIGPWKEKKILVVVEDIVSAIKVARYWGAMPLFGSSMAPAVMSKLAKQKEIEYVVFWLDPDKFIQAQKLSRLMGTLIPSAAIWTERDPKATDDSEIISLIKEAYEERDLDETCRVSC